MKKYVSILGDSLSTLDGWNPEGYNLFYQGEKCKISGVCAYQDTWWGQLIDYLGGELLVNDSWSGSRVTKLPNREQLFPSGISDERIDRLGTDCQNPDIIIVFLGDNEWGHGVSLSAESGCRNEAYTDQRNLYVFCDAYDYLLEKLKNRYPDAQIYCCTLFTTYMPFNPTFVFPAELYGNHIEAYNAAIIRIACSRNCRIIDTYIPQAPIATIDGSHPNKEGMRQLAKLMYRSMFPQADFLDCDNHYYIRIKDNPNETVVLDSPVCLCTKCYKVVSLCLYDINDYFTYINAAGGYRFRIYPDSGSKIYNAKSFFEGRMPDEYEIITYAEQLLDFLCFRYDLQSETTFKNGFNFFLFTESILD